MSAPVDVLAVMARDAASAFEARHGDREIQEFLGKESDEARAAVAELIEADEAYDNAYADAVADPANEAALSEAEERRASALARVKGA